MRKSYQYLYCNTSQPHQVTALYPPGTTCGTTSGQTASYAANYDAWGNLTTRTYNSTTGTQTYDLQDLLVRWNGSVGNKAEWYMYDGGGSRVLRRSFDGTTTTITVYAFGMEEHQYQYSGSGATATTTNNTYYYSLGGKLLGTLSGTSTLATTFLLTDTLGSVVASVSNTAGSASVLGNQAYGPYGNQRYTKGTLGTSKGYTGQYNDSLTGLDYYNARYYDPVVGRFLSADMVQGNGQGMDPYAYVGGNPETRNDPTGKFFYNPGSGEGARFVGGGKPPVFFQYTVPEQTTYSLQPTYTPPPVTTNPFQHFWNWATGGITHQVNRIQDNYALNSAFRQPTDICQVASFRASTSVATSKGSEPIITLSVGEKVWAYNPKTHKKELQPIVHLWVRHDNDLVDLTIKSTVSTQHGTSKREKSEVIHTTQKHPFLTKEKGFVIAGKLTISMHVVNINGSIGTIVGWKVIPGSMDMYNLEIAQDHTFTVGGGQWIVHNCGGYDDTGDINLKGASYKDIVARLPKSVRDQVEVNAQPNANGMYGVRWKWKSGNEAWDVHLHSADPNAPPGSYSSNGWILRVTRKPWGASGLQKSSSMDDQGNWVKYKDATDIQKTDSHIPISEQIEDPSSPFFQSDMPLNPEEPLIGPEEPLIEP